MRIKLEYPYTEHFDAGYEVLNLGRRNVVLKEKVTNRITSTSLARYRMSVHMQRYLAKHEHVDHVNNDKTDDRIENLQILSQRDNARKYYKEVIGGSNYVTAICPVCKSIFDKPLHYLKRLTYITCSLVCCNKAKKYPELQKLIIINKYKKPLED